MAKELSVLQQQAEAITTEVNKGANTSSRIGGMFSDMLDYNEEKLTELSSDLELKTLLYKEKQFTKGETDGNLLINDSSIQHVNIGDSLIIIAFSDAQINARLNSVIKYTDGSTDYNASLNFENSNIVTLEKEFNKKLYSVEWGFGSSSPETCKITIVVG